MPATPDFRFVALIVPDPQRRHMLAAAIAGSRQAIARELADYPTSGDLSEFARLDCDVAIVDLDSDVEQGLRVIEGICNRNSSTTVMAWSVASNLALIRRAIQAGARDFLTDPIDAETLREAFARISSRRARQEKAPGKLLVFVPSKSGVGVTSVATNFAIALTKESGARVVLVDLDLQMGDAALHLGLTAGCSVSDAMRNPARLDREFLSSLLMRHSSGLAVLGAPETFSHCVFPADEGAGKLFRILREEFDHVVVDSGTCHGHAQEALFEKADRLYLVTELSFPSLRNANRMISFLSARDGDRRLEVILNRFDSRHPGIDEEHARKAMGRAIDWKIPSDETAARHARDKGVPLALSNCPLGQPLVQMAKAACGKPIVAGKRKMSDAFGFFGAKNLAKPLAT